VLSMSAATTAAGASTIQGLHALSEPLPQDLVNYHLLPAILALLTPERHPSQHSSWASDALQCYMRYAHML
jgi:hypothetical protein